MKKKSNILKFAATVAIACSVSLVTNIDFVNATSNNESSIKNIREVKDGWKLEDGKWYYYISGNKKTGWLKEGHNWYYLKSDGVMASKEWQHIDGKWYMFRDSGVMYANSWYKDNNGNWYWLKDSGAMASNEWRFIDGCWYMFRDSGVMYANSWYKDNNGNWFWLKASGAMASNEILRVDNKYYKFYESGSYKSIPDNNIAKVKECDFLNIRSEANSSSEILGKVYTGNYIEVLSVGSSWTKIQTGNNTIGYVSNKYIEVQYSSEDIDARIQKVIEVAKKQLGKPYKWGGNGPDSFDCSGFTSYAYNHGANITIPRVSRDQGNFGTSVSKSNIKAGDLLFFASDGKNINHVALYMGDSQYIHAPSSGDNVRIDNITSNYFNKNYYSARRVIN